MRLVAASAGLLGFVAALVHLAPSPSDNTSQVRGERLRQQGLIASLACEGGQAHATGAAVARGLGLHGQPTFERPSEIVRVYQSEISYYDQSRESPSCDPHDVNCYVHPAPFPKPLVRYDPELE